MLRRGDVVTIEADVVIGQGDGLPDEQVQLEVSPGNKVWVRAELAKLKRPHFDIGEVVLWEDDHRLHKVVGTYGEMLWIVPIDGDVIPSGPYSARADRCFLPSTEPTIPDLPPPPRGEPERLVPRTVHAEACEAPLVIEEAPNLVDYPEGGQ